MRLTIVDDSTLFREGLVRVARDLGFEIVGQAGDAQSLVDLIRADPPDVAVLDIRMPPTFTTEGLVAAREMRSAFPSLGVLVLSQYVDTHHVMELIASGGGIGYLLKDHVGDISEFGDAVRRIAAGGSVIDPDVVAELVARRRHRDVIEELTEREQEVLHLMAQGRTNSAIGSRLHLSSKTVEAHIRNIFMKLQLEPAEGDHRRVLAVLTYLRA
ncbi:MAG: DNA-binding response regulator [Actinobacteria bacterium 13_1_20CM_2_65_11]|nr:MAG: DNA-binding response regulator [Chloroflexi bacterium 13_1_40CM_65_17]OLC66833.1 MAG: DNA-binding response regulator [Actinobacteria bacterium 13_1_40CM_4_65_12]OLD23777.1 MAG: DNA-binding response regulator [Chloroflexi bacterium 13_1_40CM_3_65_12]OLD48712.1 MAG: DNA-binding response regulator [Actinobacteria bacterium 13_1_40CM_2_65_8]OLE78086.1 MAG: DNA-binding response regulator [Actinobacteria bacterium 13_1_20CM_2_65_11]